MELRDYLRVLRRRWLLILGSAAVVVALAAAYTFTATPQYASDSRILVSAANSRDSDASTSAYTGNLAVTPSKHPHLRRIEVGTPNGVVAYPAPASIVVGEARPYGAVPPIGDATHELSQGKKS